MGLKEFRYEAILPCLVQKLIYLDLIGYSYYRVGPDCDYIRMNGNWPEYFDFIFKTTGHTNDIKFQYNLPSLRAVMSKMRVRGSEYQQYDQQPIALIACGLLA